MARVALILSGCGYLDGSEIHESVLCLLACAQEGHTVSCFAPDMEQKQVINHRTQEAMREKRNVLIESARIARGAIAPLSELDPNQFDALLMPGGFGAVSNLSSFADEQEACSVHPELLPLLHAFFDHHKPIGATCIAPAILAKAFEGKASIKMTFGSGPTHPSLTKLGMKEVPADVTMMVADETHQIYTTPCYMNPPDLAGMYEGIRQVVGKLNRVSVQP